MNLNMGHFYVLVCGTCASQVQWELSPLVKWHDNSEFDISLNLSTQSSRLRLPGMEIQCLQYEAVVLTFLVVEQHCVVYKISIPKCLYFITYFDPRLGTWLNRQLICRPTGQLQLFMFQFLSLIQIQYLFFGLLQCMLLRLFRHLNVTFFKFKYLRCVFLVQIEFISLAEILTSLDNNTTKKIYSYAYFYVLLVGQIAIKLFISAQRDTLQREIYHDNATFTMANGLYFNSAMPQATLLQCIIAYINALAKSKFAVFEIHIHVHSQRGCLRYSSG